MVRQARTRVVVVDCELAVVVVRSSDSGADPIPRQLPEDLLIIYEIRLLPSLGDFP